MGKCPYCKEQLDEKRVLALAGAKKRPRIEDAILHHAKRAAIMVDEELGQCSKCEIYAALYSKTDVPKVHQCYHPYCHSETDMVENRMKERITDALVPVRCPKCRKAVVFDGGCTQMSCPNCNCAFCYICGFNLGQEINIHEAYSMHYEESRTCAKVLVQYHDSDPINWPSDEASIINKVHELQIVANLHSLRAQDPALFDQHAKTLPFEFSLKVIQEGPPSFPVLVKPVVENGLVEENQENTSEETEVAKLINRLAERLTELAEVLASMGSILPTAFKSAIERHGFTPLMLASIQGNADQVSDLISTTQNIEAMGQNGFTALMFAALLGHLETVRVLLASGANAQAVSEAGLTASLLAATRGHDEVLSTISSTAANSDRDAP